MNLFTKAHITQILNSKVNTSEIRGYQLNGNKLHILRSKRSKYTIDTDILSEM